MAAKDLTELGDFLDPILSIPYRGTRYEVPAVDAATGLRLQKLLAAGIKTQQTGKLDPATIELVSDAEEAGFFETVLGTAYDELIAAGASGPAVKMIASTAFIWHTQDFTAATNFWGAEGKAPAPNRAARRTATRTPTGAGSSTRKRASASSTTTPKASPRAKASNGGKS